MIDTYRLETAVGGICQDTEMMRLCDWYSLTDDTRLMNLSGQVKKATVGGALTNWRRQKEGLVSTRKTTDRVSVLTSCRRQGEGVVKANKNVTELEALTSWRWQREGFVRIRK